MCTPEPTTSSVFTGADNPIPTFPPPEGLSSTYALLGEPFEVPLNLCRRPPAATLRDRAPWPRDIQLDAPADDIERSRRSQAEPVFCRTPRRNALAAGARTPRIALAFKRLSLAFDAGARHGTIRGGPHEVIVFHPLSPFFMGCPPNPCFSPPAGFLHENPPAALAASQGTHASCLFKATPVSQANVDFLAKRAVQRQIGQMIGQNGWHVCDSISIFMKL